MSILEKIVDKSGVVVSAILKLGEKNVELFGEIHNSRDNGFYIELFKKNLLKDAVVLVEHSSVLCHLHEREHPLFENAKGSEYIFFQRMKANKDVVCVDNRIEKGLFSAMEEHSIMRFFENQDFSREYVASLKNILEDIYRVVGNCVSNKEIFMMLYPEEFAMFIATIVRQYKILLSISKKRDAVSFLKKKGDLIDDVANGIVASRTGQLLIKNIQKVGSMLVDVNILQSILSAKTNTVIVFTGAAHVIKLVEKLTTSSYTIPPTEELIDISLPIPLESQERELDFLKKLNI